ncbi:hypothetical protein EBZ37_00930 [bacterium]|nr:hypothetical protein [bacterium]
MTFELAFIIHFVCVCFMTGLIWLIQLVHYPLMNRVSSERFAEFHHAHTTRITGIVAPVMLLELFSALIMLLFHPAQSLSSRSVQFCFALTVGVFLATAFLSVPQHALLSRGFSERAHRRLVGGNWVRTVIWSAHLVLVLMMAISSRGVHG